MLNLSVLGFPLCKVEIIAELTSLEGLRLKLKLQCFGHLMRRADSLEKTLMLGRREEKRVAEDEIVRQHHRLDGYEFEKILGDGGGQGSLVCCSPRGHKESDTAAAQQRTS